MLRYIPDRLLSVFWMFCWACFFSTAMSLVKTLEGVPTATIVFVRFALSVLLVFPFLMRGGKEAFMTNRIPLHLFNVVFRVCAIWSTYYAYANLPLGLAASIGFTGPMLAIILAMAILKEKVGWRKWIAIIVGYSGVLVMAQPEQMGLNIAIIVALAANLASSLAKVVTKEITKTDSTLQIMFYANILSLTLSGAIMGYHWVTPDMDQWLIIAIIGICGSLSQFSYLRALDVGNVSLVAPFEYLRLFFAIPIGYLMFAEVPSNAEIVGCAIIVLSSIYLTYREMQKDREERLSS